MKRILLTLFLIFISLTIFAQTQQGIVKTRGRMVNGQLVAGQRLTGATITLSIGNPLVSGNNGAFSFNVPTGKNYSLVAAKKQGYTLADPEYTRRSFKYSAGNPFYVVLENENQRQADIREATDKVRRTLKREIRKREDELDELRETNAITQERYDFLRAEFYTYRQKSENLVKEMAERYASTDYDQLDEFNRQVQMLIEEGELQKADSMIRSKGDMEQRVADYHNVVAANQKERENLTQRQQALTQSESGAAKTYEDLSQDLLRRSEIFLQAYQQDSALYCLKLRADLDTTNVEAVNDYAELCYGQNLFLECEKYYKINYHAFITENNLLKTAEMLHNLGSLYTNMRNYSLSHEYLSQALSMKESLYEQNPELYRETLSITQNGLGILYFYLHDYSMSEHYFKLSLNNSEYLFSKNPNKYKESIARKQNNLGNLYIYLHDYINSEQLLKQALKNNEELFEINNENYRLNLSTTQKHLGDLYKALKNYQLSEVYYQLSLENREKLFYLNPDAFRDDLIKTQNSLGIIYAIKQDYENAAKYYMAALNNTEFLFNHQPKIYRPYLATLQNNLGLLYHDLNQYEKSEYYFRLALVNKELLFSLKPETYRADLVSTQNNLASLLRDKHDIENCKQLYFLSLEHLILLYEKSPKAHRIEFIGIIRDFVNLLSEENEFEEALSLVNKMIDKFPNLAELFDSKGEILLMQGKNDEALAMWKKVLELNPNFLDDYPDGTNLSNGLKKLGLIE